MLFFFFQSYCSILYEKPNISIYIRKKKVNTSLMRTTLSVRQTDTYGPKGKVNYFYISRNTRLLKTQADTVFVINALRNYTEPIRMACIILGCIVSILEVLIILRLTISMHQINLKQSKYVIIVC
jgi:hypothetical protein